MEIVAVRTIGVLNRFASRAFESETSSLVAPFHAARCEGAHADLYTLFNFVLTRP